MIHERSSLLSQLLWPLVATFVVVLLSGGVVIWGLISHTAFATIAREIDAEFDVLAQRTQRLKIVAVVDDIDYRLTHNIPDRQKSVFSLIDVDGSQLIGNVDVWPSGMKESGAVKRVKLTVDGRADDYLVGVRRVEDDYTLLIGRSLGELHALQSILMWSLIVVGSCVIVAAIGIASVIGGRLAARFEAINATILSARALNAPETQMDFGRDEIGRLSGSVDIMVSTLHRQMHHQQNIASVIAHEFRSPLAQLRAALRSQIQRDASITEDAGQSLETVEGLLSLCDSLLDIAAHESTFAAPSSIVALDDVAVIIIDLFRDLAEDKSITLLHETSDAHVLGDKSLLSRLLANLVENALYATPRDGAVSIRTFRHDRFSVLRVEDTGPGVEVPEMDAMIRQGQTAGANETDQRTGHGIGLRMLQAIAIRHGAAISVSNRSPGLRIDVRFPGLNTAA
tara:strand:- start:5455 stop:6816 length:1362 start_codon:yes stop_codon:yes gene_type:complete